MNINKVSITELIQSGASGFLRKGLVLEDFFQILVEPQHFYSNEKSDHYLVVYHNDFYSFDNDGRIMGCSCKFDVYEPESVSYGKSLFTDYKEWKDRSPDRVMKFLQENGITMSQITAVPYTGEDDHDDELIRVGVEKEQSRPLAYNGLTVAYTRNAKKLIFISLYF